MIKAIIVRVIIYTALAFAIGLYVGKANASYSTTLREEPAISIYQGIEKDTSVVVLQWPSGRTERLVIKNKDLKKGSMIWLNDRLNEHESREK